LLIGLAERREGCVATGVSPGLRTFRGNESIAENATIDMPIQNLLVAGVGENNSRICDSKVYWRNESMLGERRV
jgi:hypothetical protein